MHRFRRTSLFKKLLAFYLVILVVSFYFMIAEGRELIYDQVQAETLMSLQGAADRLIAASLNTDVYTVSTIRGLRSQFEMAAEASNSQILIIRQDGDIILDTSLSVGSPAYYHNDYNVIEHGESAFLHRDHTYSYTIGGYLSTPSLCVSRPLKRSSYFDGFLIFAQSDSVINNRSDYYYNLFETLYFIVMGLLLLTYVGVYLFCFMPLRKIRNGAKDFAIGRDNPPIVIRSHDEYGELAQTLNVIGGELSKFDEYQRSFLSNISHDFRSPLTSIRGYLQAMLDGVIEPDEQEKYLKIILSETERLTKLTGGIMDINTLDKDHIFLQIAPFDIHKTISSITDTLTGTATSRKITYRKNLHADGLPLYVDGDSAKIYQVIYNLLDNATKFSHEGGIVEVTTTLKRGKVLISVKDTGIGIPKEDLGKIFDRFYKSDLSRGKDKTGTGLGLSICKEILQAHKQTIDVVSTEGGGTTFTFGLPVASTPPA